jgi:hypothetical protein
LNSLAEIGKRVERDEFEGSAGEAARELLALGEDVLAHWTSAKNLAPTQGKLEGFRLLALHRQGARDDPSFNACRESCRELVYHYNLIALDQDHADTIRRLRMMRMLAAHIYYFVTGKMQNAQLGEFCCSSRSLRLDEAL